MRLLTFLGTGKYKEVRYRLYGQECQARLCPVAIARITGATEIVAFVTKEARKKWFNELEQQAAAFHATCRPVRIGLPADEAGMWDLFRAVQGELTGPSVALDVTHAFRAIPFVAMAVAGFARATNPEAVAAVYYGAFDAKDAGVAPIIDLTSLVSVLDWTAAVGAFQRYGDASMIAELTSRNCRQLADAGMKEAASALGHVASHIESASNDLLACRPRDVPKAARRALDTITENAATTEAHAPAFHAVRETLRDALTALTMDTGSGSHRAMLEAELAMVRWYVEHRGPLHALALSREWLVTLACLLKGLDWSSRDQRSKAEKHIHDKEVPVDLVETFERVSQWRNDVLHCGMRESHAKAATVLDNVKQLPDILAPLIALVPEVPSP